MTIPPKVARCAEPTIRLACATSWFVGQCRLYILLSFRTRRRTLLCRVSAGDAGPAVTDLARVTMSYMKTSTITIRLDDALGRELDQACARTGRTRSELARDALRRQLALLRFERLRKRTLPLAEAQGYLTDEDVFRDVS